MDQVGLSNVDATEAQAPIRGRRRPDEPRWFARHLALLVLRHVFPGGNSGEATPVPIPNTEVKLSRADGTAGAILWESRSLPGFFLKARFV